MKALVEISGHGFGHLMQAMPVVAALRERIPGIDIAVRSSLSPDRFAREVARFGPFRTLSGAAPDFHPRMKNSYAADITATIAECRRIHDSFAACVGEQQRFIAAEQFDLVIADISPLPLAAAQEMGIPSVALCSLDWASTLAFIPDLAGPLRDTVRLLHAVYAGCDLFLRPEPHVGCAGYANCRSIGHVARTGANVRNEIDAALGIDPEARLVMISSGGMDGFPFAIDIPRRDGIFWILPDWLVSPDDDRLPLSAFERWPYVDLVASLDTLVGKPGYGLVVEAVTNGVPFASLERSDWVDVASLETWGAAHGVLGRIGMNDIRSGRWVSEVERLARAPRAPRLAPTGATEAANFIARLLGRD